MSKGARQKRRAERWEAGKPKLWSMCLPKLMPHRFSNTGACVHCEMPKSFFQRFITGEPI